MWMRLLPDAKAPNCSLERIDMLRNPNPKAPLGFGYAGGMLWGWRRLGL
jgi:hypothetical protein